MGSYALKALLQSASDLTIRRISPAELLTPNDLKGVGPELLFHNVNQPRDVERLDDLGSRSDALSRFLRLDSTKR